jgi:ketopantoate hydroxymethyltransferase
MELAFNEFISDIDAGSFPAAEHTMDMPDEEWMILMAEIGN